MTVNLLDVKYKRALNTLLWSGIRFAKDSYFFPTLPLFGVLYLWINGRVWIKSKVSRNYAKYTFMVHKWALENRKDLVETDKYCFLAHFINDAEIIRYLYCWLFKESGNKNKDFP